MASAQTQKRNLTEIIKSCPPNVGGLFCLAASHSPRDSTVRIPSALNGQGRLELANRPVFVLGFYIFVQFFDQIPLHSSPVRMVC